MTLLRLFLASLLCLSLACGDDDAGSDAGGGSDSAVADGGDDSGAADDAGSDGGPSTDAGATDAGSDAVADDAGADDTGVDAGAPDGGTDASMPDVGLDAPASPCDGLQIGRECPCRDDFVCIEGRCAPGRERATCGGIVGEMCTTRTFPECMMPPGSTAGVCLSSQERECVCAEHRDLYSCRR